MRFIHHDADRILEYVVSNNLHVSMIGNDGVPAAPVASADAITTMLRESKTLWGTALPYYLSVSASREPETLPLTEAVADVAGKPNKTFLVVAYQDGGIITVSGSLLAFQNGADPAEWWRPTL